MKLLCLFPPLNEKNYRDEAFVHIVHFTTTWPLAVRRCSDQTAQYPLKEENTTIWQ